MIKQNLKDALDKAVELDVRELNATPNDDPSRAKLAREVVRDGKIILDIDSQEHNQKINEQRFKLDEKTRAEQHDLDERRFKEECSKNKNNQKISEEELDLKKKSLKLEETKLKNDQKYHEKEFKLKENSEKNDLKIREKELSLKEKELKLKENDQQINLKKIDIELINAKTNQQRLEFEIKCSDKEFELKNREIEIKEIQLKNDLSLRKWDLALKIAGVGATVFGIIVTVIDNAASRHQKGNFIKANMAWERLEHGFVNKNIQDLVRDYDKKVSKII